MKTLVGFLVMLAWLPEPGGYFQLDTQAFFQLPAVGQGMNLAQPDTLLLDAALFHASNEARQANGVLPLLFDLTLYDAAASHATAMINQNFYGHENPYSPAERTVQKRVELRGLKFYAISENIGQYQTIDTPDVYGYRRNRRTRTYEYFDPRTFEPCQPFTYAGYARYAVRQWLASPRHRATLLNPHFTHLACAARLVPHPYDSRPAPFARLVQNFGQLRGSER